MYSVSFKCTRSDPVFMLHLKFLPDEVLPCFYSVEYCKYLFSDCMRLFKSHIMRLAKKFMWVKPERTFWPTQYIKKRNISLPRIQKHWHVKTCLLPCPFIFRFAHQSQFFQRPVCVSERIFLWYWLFCNLTFTLSDFLTCMKLINYVNIKVLSVRTGTSLGVCF